MSYSSIFTYGKDLLKIPLDEPDSLEKNEKNPRIFRDKTTDLFASTLFSDREKMYKFLDYTYHAINSHLILNINKKLREMNQHYIRTRIIDRDRIQEATDSPSTNKPNETPITIRPLNGTEQIIFLFKGGSVMNILYNQYIDTITNNYGNLTSNDMKNFYSGKQWIIDYINRKSQEFQFNYDIEKNTLLPKNDNVGTFMGDILKTKFAVSDIDYTVVIIAYTIERYLILHEIIIKLLAEILDVLTTEFDAVLSNILEGRSVNMVDPNIRADDTEAVILHPYLDVLNALKIALSEQTLISDIKTYDGMHDPVYFTNPVFYRINQQPDNVPLKMRLVYILFIANNLAINRQYITSIYELYYLIEIITSIDYIDLLNINFFNHGYNINNIYTHLQTNINTLINGKKYDLFILPYYNINEIMQIRDGLVNIYRNLKPDAPEFKEKIASSFWNPPDTIKLTNNILNITADDIHFEKRRNVYVRSILRMPPYTIEFDTSNNNKYHYMTFNSIIRTKRGARYIDFDLIRSKLNVVIDGPFFMENDVLLDKFPIPTEFIDISIPSYDDAGLYLYKKEIEEKNYDAYYLNVSHQTDGTIKKYVLKSYGPSDIAHDIIYILFSQNSFEPWLDPKYAKRIIRLLYFVILTRLLKSISDNNINHLTNLLNFIYYCKIIRENMDLNIQNKNSQLIVNTYVTFLDTQTVQPADIITTVNTIYNYIDPNKPESIEKFMEYFALSYISEDYQDVGTIIESIFFWYNIFNKPIADIGKIISFAREYHGWQPLNLPGIDQTKEINIIKQNFNKLLDTIVNAGLKLYFIFYNMYSRAYTRNANSASLYPGNLVQNIQGGSLTAGRSNYQKYLKYKAKYLSLKKIE